MEAEDTRGVSGGSRHEPPESFRCKDRTDSEETGDMLRNAGQGVGGLQFLKSSSESDGSDVSDHEAEYLGSGGRTVEKPFTSSGSRLIATLLFGYVSRYVCCDVAVSSEEEQRAAIFIALQIDGKN